MKVIVNRPVAYYIFQTFGENISHIRSGIRNKVIDSLKAWMPTLTIAMVTMVKRDVRKRLK